jgi:hypothetical protein
LLIYLVTAVVCLVPGGLLGFVVPPGRERWIAWAAAPILTLGLTASAMAWLPVARLPSAAPWVLGTEIMLAVLMAAGSWLTARKRPTAAPAAPAAPGAPAAPAAVPSAEKILAAEDGAAASVTLAAPSGGGGPAAGPPGQAMTWRTWVTGSAPRLPLADLIGVAVPLSVAVISGKLLLARVTRPPGWDAMNHGMLTRNIIETGSTVSSAVCTTGQPLPQIACHFYPLGADVSWAQTAILSGGRISTVMLAWSVLIGPAALVMAVYAAVRAFGGGPLVAGSAAIAPVLVSQLWPSLLSGRPPESFAPGMGIAVALLASLAIRGRYPVRLGVLAGLGFAGVIVTHTYDVLFAGILSLAFLFAERTRPSLRPALTGMGAIAVAALAGCAPLASALLGARGERSASVSRHSISFGRAWHFWVTTPRHYVLLGTSPYGGPSRLHLLPVRVALWLTLLCLLASPLCLVFKELRWARPWLLTWVAWTALGIWTSVSGSGVALFLSSLWYGEQGRLRTMAYPVQGVLAVAGACAIGLCLYRLVMTVARRGRDLRLQGLAAGAAAAVFAASLIGLAAVPAVHRTLEKQYRQREPVGAEYSRVFTWLARYTPPGKVVAYKRNVDYMIWSYADYGVPGLFGISPRVTASKPDNVARQRAWRWLIGNPGVLHAGCLVRRYRVEYVVTGSQHLPEPKAFPRTMDYTRARLAATPNLTLVHADGGIRVYRVTKAGMACPG